MEKGGLSCEIWGGQKVVISPGHQVEFGYCSTAE